MSVDGVARQLREIADVDDGRTSGLNIHVLAMKLLVRFAYCLMLMTTHVLGGPFEEGITAYDQTQYGAALRLWLPLADQGHVAAQLNVGILYEKGLGVPQDHAEAARWYLKAAQQGDTEAQFYLGALYETGTGVAQDLQLARKWFEAVLASARSDAGSSAMKQRARQRLSNLSRPSEELIQFNGGRFAIVRSPEGVCVVAIQGVITRDALLKFDDVIQRSAQLGCKTRSLLLESPGGSLIDGLELGREVRFRGFQTLTRYECASACALIFLAGTERLLVGSRAKIGFHQPATGRGNERRCSASFDSSGVRDIRKYLRWVLPGEIDPVMELIMQTSCDAIAWLHGQRALELGIATRLESENVDVFGPLNRRR